MSDLGQRIKEAATKATQMTRRLGIGAPVQCLDDFHGLACPANILALLAEKDADIERLKAVQFSPTGDNHHNAAICPYCSPKSEIERLTRERDEWKRIAGQYRVSGQAHKNCVFWDTGPRDNRCDICKAYDALVVKGE